MANYECTIRSNYFAVKDGEAFEKFMENVAGEDVVQVFKTLAKDGTIKYGFGCYGHIAGWFPENSINEADCDVA